MRPSRLPTSQMSWCQRLRRTSSIRARVLLTRLATGLQPSRKRPRRVVVQQCDEAQEVECFRLAHPALASVQHSEPAKFHEASFVLVKAKPEPGQPLFYDRFEKLCAVLLDNPDMFGYCYTQFTDIYQEQNGIYKFDRSGKFDLARLHAAQRRPAAIERGASPGA